MTRWLVTGAAGVVGSLFTRSMLSRGDEVIGIDSMDEPRNVWIVDGIRKDYPKCNIWRGRVESSADFVRDVLADVDAVVHAAASTGIPYSGVEPADDWIRNAEATRTLLDALRECPKPTVIMSSVKPYRVTKDTVTWGIREDDPLDPDEPYAASKAAGSLLAQAYARSYGIPLTVIRFSNLYGPAPCHGARHGWLTWLCISAAIGKPIRVEGGGQQSRDMLHSSDINAAIIAALEAGPKGDMFVVGGGSGNRISVTQAATLLQEMTGVRIVSAPGRQHEDMHVWVDHSKFTAATGWEPKVNVIDGIRDVLAWALRHKSELSKLYETE